MMADAADDAAVSFLSGLSDGIAARVLAKVFREYAGRQSAENERLREALSTLLADVKKSREVIYDNPDDAYGLNASIAKAEAALAGESGR
jgi:hypothetical protein